MPAMKPYSCWIIRYLLIFTGLILTLDADGDDSDCTVGIRVRRHTVYNASVGQELKIKCTVIFCNDSPRRITWEKRDENYVLVDVSSDNHIKTEWNLVNKSAGISYLIFTRILHSDAGQYMCQGGDSVGHFIRVIVHDLPELTTATWTTVAAESELPADTLWPLVYRVVATLVFVIIVILICIASKRGCKGKPRKARQPSERHVYDNDV